jgi:hypothetical protein
MQEDKQRQPFVSEGRKGIRDKGIRDKTIYKYLTLPVNNFYTKI